MTTRVHTIGGQHNLWKWIVPVLLIVVLAFAARAYAGALGRADAAADRADELTVELALVEDSNESYEQALADADSAKLVRTWAAVLRIVELDRETKALERTVRDLAAADVQNAEGVDAALRDLGAVLSPGAVPALRQLQDAYEVQLSGRSDQIVALTDHVAAVEEEKEILVVELAAERFARGLADVVASGLRGQIVVLEERDVARVIEIGSLRDAVAPSFFTRLGQNAGLAIGSAVFGGALVFLVTSGG